MKQPTNDLAQLVKLAHDSLPELGQIVLLASNGQEVVGRPGDGVKSPSRILEKAQEVGLNGVVGPNWSDNGCTTRFVGFRSEVALEQFINQNPEFRVFRLDNWWFMD